jgi:catechol 2,3-dioxygenase
MAQVDRKVNTPAPWDPEEAEARATPVSAELPAASTVGAVELTVADLERSLAYYRTLGLQVLAADGSRALLGVDGVELVGLVEEPSAWPAGRHSGLYHFALLLPQRRDLAVWLAHAARERVPLVGLSDHFVSEALYLSDPDGHGIEIYWDRPREVWEGRVAARMTTLPLDVDALLGELGGDPLAQPFTGLPRGTRMGHIHLRVACIPDTLVFYRDLLGFALMAQLGSHALFLSAGGYHHHVGANTWESAGAPAAPPGAAALRHARIVLPDAAARELVLARLRAGGHGIEEHPAGPVVRDPSGIALVLALRPG